MGRTDGVGPSVGAVGAFGAGGFAPGVGGGATSAGTGGGGSRLLGKSAPGFTESRDTLNGRKSDSLRSSTRTMWGVSVSTMSV